MERNWYYSLTKENKKKEKKKRRKSITSDACTHETFCCLHDSFSCYCLGRRRQKREWKKKVRWKRSAVDSQEATIVINMIKVSEYQFVLPVLD